MGQRVPFAVRQGPQARAQLVAPGPDRLERRAGRKADLALDAVDLDGGGQAPAIFVDAFGDAGAAARGAIRDG